MAAWAVEDRERLTRSHAERSRRSAQGVRGQHTDRHGRRILRPPRVQMLSCTCGRTHYQYTDSRGWARDVDGRSITAEVAGFDSKINKPGYQLTTFQQGNRLKAGITFMIINKWRSTWSAHGPKQPVQVFVPPALLRFSPDFLPTLGFQRDLYGTCA